MKRRLFNLLAGISLLLCVAMGGLWITSYRYGLSSPLPLARNTTVGSVFGEVGVWWRTPDPHFSVLSNPSNRKGFNRHNFLIGFTGKFIAPIDAAKLGYPPETIIGRIMAIHDWVLTALFCVLPLIWMRDYWGERRSAQRIQAGLCAECGYDLQASPDRCPECGTIPVKVVGK